MSGGFTLHGTELRDRQKVALVDVELKRKVAAGVDKFAVRKNDVLDLIGLSTGHGDAVDGDSDQLRAAARAMRHRTIERLPEILEKFADNLLANGVNVHWANDAAAANAAIIAIAQRIGAKRVVKGKSMATEETGLNEALAAIGADVVETDLGEWIIQLDADVPSHIIAPALHLDRYDIKRIFEQHAGAESIEPTPEVLNAFARRELRQRFLQADLGISGCNLAIAETGSIMLVENEGNGRMCTTLPRVHVAVMGMERIVENWDDANLVLNLLARSRDRSAAQQLHEHRVAAAWPRRRRRPRGGAHRHPRQWPLGSARHRVRRDAQLHPLRRVSQRVPGLPSDGRPRLRLGVLGSDGCGAHASAGRQGESGSGRGGQCVNAVRGVHGRVSGRHPAPGPLACGPSPTGR
jgi:L-lactate utilization protein LutC